MFSYVSRMVKYMLRGVELVGVDHGAVRVAHLVLRSPMVCVLLNTFCTRFAQGQHHVFCACPVLCLVGTCCFTGRTIYSIWSDYGVKSHATRCLSIGSEADLSMFYAYKSSDTLSACYMIVLGATMSMCLKMHVVRMVLRRQAWFGD